jgi:hypothetical protein
MNGIAMAGSSRKFQRRGKGLSVWKKKRRFSDVIAGIPPCLVFLRDQRECGLQDTATIWLNFFNR